MAQRWVWRVRRWSRIGVLSVAASALTYLVAWSTFRALHHRDDVGTATLLSLAVGVLALGPPLLSATRSQRRATPEELVAVARELRRKVLKSEATQRRILLGRDTKKIDVEFELRKMPSRNAVGAMPIGHINEIFEYYERLIPRRLVIIGEPGAGKTTMALELLLGLLERGPLDAAVPVRFSLSSWPYGLKMSSWLAYEIAQAYRLAPSVAEALIDGNLVIPFLDGLDEMDSDGSPPERAANALASINAEVDGTQAAPVVLTCREDQYYALAGYGELAGEWGTRLMDAATVKIKNVSPAQVVNYIESRVASPDPWRPVVEDLGRGVASVLADSINTPWIITLAITVYGGFLKISSIGQGDYSVLGRLRRRHPTNGQLSRPYPQDLIKHAADMENHLLRDYVRAATDLHPQIGRHSYNYEDVERWLAFLARYLSDNANTRRTVGDRALSGTDLILHQLWPIMGERSPRLVDAAIAITMSVPGFAWFAAFCASRAAYWEVILSLVIIGYALALLRATTAYWIAPHPIDYRGLLSWRGLAQLCTGVGLGILAALLFTPWAGAAVGFSAWIGGGLSVTPTQGLVTIKMRESSPKRPLHDDLVLSLLAGLSAGPAVALAFSQYLGSVAGWLCGVAYGAAVGCTVASAPWRRYIAMLLCAHNRLPWRLGRFLDWACDAGLMRVSGISYQFRHDELRVWLASQVYR